MTGREGPGPERPGPDYPPEWDQEPAEEVTRERGECLSGDPQQWCRWNPECRSCAPVAAAWSRHALPVHTARGAAPVVTFSRCPACAALIAPGAEYLHDEWHARLPKPGAVPDPWTQQGPTPEPPL